jgi:hypothetical protein
VESCPGLIISCRLVTFFLFLCINKGTGLLGLALSRLLKYRVTVTEFSGPLGAESQEPSSVYNLLQRNITRHNKKQNDVMSDVQIFPLDWSEAIRDINNWIDTQNNADNKCCSDDDNDNNINSISDNNHDISTEFDLVLGTDVLFTPSLVVPLLLAASLLTKADTGTCLFCMQIRCEDSHQLFLQKAGEYFDSFRDISEEVYETTGCAWGRYVECFVFEMKGGRESAATTNENGKKRKNIHECDELKSVVSKQKN